MGTPFHALATLVQRLRSSLPIRFTLTDPFTGGQLEIVRDNLLADFIVDTANLAMEAQMVSAFYLEVARLHRAAEYSADIASTEYVQWKSERAKEFRAQAPAAAAAKPKRGKAAAEGAPEEEKAVKGPTNAMVEEYYRSHADYKKYSGQEKLLRAWAGLFEDAKKGVEMKSRIIDGQQRSMRGFEHVERAVHDMEEKHFEIPASPPPPPNGQPPYQAPVTAPPAPGSYPFNPYGGAPQQSQGSMPPMPPFPGSR